MITISVEATVAIVGMIVAAAYKIGYELGKNAKK